MHPQRALILGFLLTVVLLAGCNSAALEGMLGKSWEELGDEKSAGPYSFRPPKKFELDPTMSRSMAGETKVMYRGPRFGKSEPGIVLSYGAHHQDVSQREPDWSSAVRAVLMRLRSQCTNFQQQTGQRTTINGIPAVRVQFSGDLTIKGETRPMQGIGYLLLDDTYLLFALGMDFGPNAKTNVEKLEKSLRTISRPGYTMPSYAWNGGGHSSSASGSVAMSSGSSGALGAAMGEMNSGNSRPGSAGLGSSYPGMTPGYTPGSHGGSAPMGSRPPGSMAPGTVGHGSVSRGGIGMGSGYPGSRPPVGSGGYPGSRPGLGPGSYPGSMGPGSRPPGSMPPGLRGAGAVGSRGMGSGRYPGGMAGSGMGGYPGRGYTGSRAGSAMGRGARGSRPGIMGSPSSMGTQSSAARCR